MRTKLKKLMCSILASATILSAASVVPVMSASAEENTGNSLILSTDQISITENASVTFTAVLEKGFDASRLACVVADETVAAITPIASIANAAAYQVTYISSGTTAAAVYSLDDPTVVAYITINASPLIMEIPAKLGTNLDNYCTLVSYEFVPYDFTYSDFNDYESTLNVRYQCASYEDDGFSKWGCYGFFYDAAGNVLSKVHLYCSTLSLGRVYHSEFNVPVGAVRFTVEGFN